MMQTPMPLTPNSRSHCPQRPIGRLSILGLLLALLTLVGIGPAHAGGPTSVLATNYSDGRAGAAITGTAIYDELVREIGVTGISGGQAPTSQTTQPAEVSDVPAIRLTWFIHDNQPWRIDGIHEAGQNIWISTRESFDGCDLYEVKPMWHKAAHPKKLRSLLIGMGVMVGDANESTSATPAAAPPSPAAVAPPADSGSAAATAAADSSASATPATPATPETGTRLAWLAGAGALTALALGFLAGRRTIRRDAGPDQGDSAVVWNT